MMTCRCYADVSIPWNPGKVIVMKANLAHMRPCENSYGKETYATSIADIWYLECRI